MTQLTENEIRAMVLTSPAYREHVKLLYPLYVHSREDRSSPKDLLLIQSMLAEALKFYQDETRKFKKEKNNLDLALAKRLIKIVQDITDGIAWRTLRYNSLLIQRLASTHKTGHLEETFTYDFDVAHHIIEERGCLVIVNDLTRVLRYGDLTILDNDSVYIQENKGGKASARDGRASRQKRKLKQFCQFYNKKSRIEKGQKELLIHSNISFETYLPKIEKAIKVAQQDGYSQTQISECLIVEVYTTKHKLTRNKPIPFEDREYILRFDNLRLFNQAATRHAPYTIYPFDNQTCFDLVTGDIFIISHLDMQSLQAQFLQSNLNLSFPDGLQMLQAYADAPIWEQKKMMEQFRFIVKDNQTPNSLQFDADLLGLLYMEYLKEDILISMAKFMMQEVKPKQGEIIRIYPGFDNELSVWN
jgi:hypothetical protein